MQNLNKLQSQKGKCNNLCLKFDKYPFHWNSLSQKMLLVNIHRMAFYFARKVHPPKGHCTLSQKLDEPFSYKEMSSSILSCFFFLSKVGWASSLLGDEHSILLSFFFYPFCFFLFKVGWAILFWEMSLLTFGEPFCYKEMSLFIFGESAYRWMCTELWTSSQKRIRGKWISVEWALELRIHLLKPNHLILGFEDR